MKKQKLKLHELQVSSFVTEDASKFVGGAVSLPNCNYSIKGCIQSLPVQDCIIVASQNSSCP